MTALSRAISQWRRRQVVGGLLLTLVTLVGAMLRLQAIGEPLWVDELHTGWVVSDRLADIPPRAAAGNQAPAYFYVPWFSSKLWGSHPLALRLPTLVAGIALIPCAGWLTWRWTHCGAAGLLAATLIAIDRDFVFYGVEARVYALLQLIGLLHIAAFVALQRRSTWRNRAIWLGSGVLLFYLHYTTASVVAAEFLARLVLIALVPGCLWRDAAPRATSSGSPQAAAGWRGLLLDAGLFTLGVLPAVAHLAEVAKRRRNWGELLSADRLESLFPWWPYLGAPLLCVVIVALLWRVRGRFPTWRKRRLPVMVSLAGALFVPVLVALIATETNQAQLLRYRYLIIPATLAPLLSGLIVALAPTNGWNRIVAVIVLLFAFPTSELSVRIHYDANAVAMRRENWPAAIQRVNQDETSSHWPVLLCGALVEDRQLGEGMPLAGWASREALVTFCRFPLRSTYVLRRADEDIVPLPSTAGRRTTEADRERITAARGAWLIVRGGKERTRAIGDDLRDELSAAGHRFELASLEEYGGVTLVKLVRNEQSLDREGREVVGERN